MALVDGRPELSAEVEVAPADVRDYMVTAFRELLGIARFRDAVAGHLPPDAASQARAPLVLDRIERILRAAERIEKGETT